MKVLDDGGMEGVNHKTYNNRLSSTVLFCQSKEVRRLVLRTNVILAREVLEKLEKPLLRDTVTYLG